MNELLTALVLISFVNYQVQKDAQTVANRSVDRRR